MKPRQIFWLLLTHLLGLAGCQILASPPKIASQKVEDLPLLKPEFFTYNLSTSTVRVVKIPVQGQYLVTSSISDRLQTVEEIAQQHQAIAVLNAGFFDPVNGKSTSFVVQQGKLIADPRLNERLTNNPELAPYLNKIFNRSEWRRYLCDNAIRYDIVRHGDRVPNNCQLLDAAGGGSQLLPKMTLVEEGFVEEIKGKIVRDPLGSDRLNARTAVGITASGDLIWLMAAQKPELPKNSGLTLAEVAQLMRNLGAVKAMNLDGGSSSSLYYRQQVFYGKVTESGTLAKRPVKSVLLLHKN